MPYREYLCNYCSHQWDELVYSADPDEYRWAECPHCDSQAELLPALIGGVNGVSLSGARPKNQAAMKRGKAYTGKPGFVDEPQVEEKKKKAIEEQLEFNFDTEATD